MQTKLIIGLTGIFGSGKSTVAHLFEELGAAVVDADKLAHEALWKGSEVYKKVAALFPEALPMSSPNALVGDSKSLNPRQKRAGMTLDRESRGDDNYIEGLDRKVIAGIVFQDSKRLKDLEKIVHPYVRTRIQEEIDDAQEKVVVLEVPLLFEAGVDKFCDVTVVVSAPLTEIVKRLKEKGFSPDQIKARLKAQMPLKEKIKRADFVVRNIKTLKETKQQVEKLWRGFKKNA